MVNVQRWTVAIATVACLLFTSSLSEDPDWSVVSPADMYDNCEKLSPELNIWWTVDTDTPTVWFAVEAQLSKSNDEFVAFGISGDIDKPKMAGADVTVVDFHNNTARARDFYLQDPSPCSARRKTGVCPDTVFDKGEDSIGKVFGALYRKDDNANVAVVHYSRPVDSKEDRTDKPFLVKPNQSQSIIWAIGNSGKEGLPKGHRLVTKQLLRIEFGRAAAVHNCEALVPEPELSSRLVTRSEGGAKTNTNGGFVGLSSNKSSSSGSSSSENASSSSSSSASASSSEATVKSVPTVRHHRFFEPMAVSDRVLVFSIGPSGGHDPDIVYYVNEVPAPEIVLTRGLNYTIQTMTGMNPAEKLYYHPLVISAQGDKTPLIGPAKGRLCLWSSSLQRNLVPKSFAAFQKSLSLGCDAGSFDYFSWSPDASTPDRLFYQSTTSPGIGGIITIVDPTK